MVRPGSVIGPQQQYLYDSQLRMRNLKHTSTPGMCVCVLVRVHICVCMCVRLTPRFATTGWRRPIGCFELQVIFRKRATNYRDLLWKMTCKDKASYDSTPPCLNCRFVNVCVCVRVSECVRVAPQFPAPNMESQTFLHTWYVRERECVCVWVWVCVCVCVCLHNSQLRM